MRNRETKARIQSDEEQRPHMTAGEESGQSGV